MQPEGLIADDEAVGGRAVAGWVHKGVDAVYHVLLAALTQGQGPVECSNARLLVGKGRERVKTLDLGQPSFSH